MNELIKQLAEQAIEEKLTHDEFITALNTEPWEFYGFRISELEKFAELIVKECIDYCGENLSKTVGGALKIHFGVEE
jgi:hypothetical protein